MVTISNELRKRQLSVGGLVEDNPLTSGATLLTSAGLSAISSGVASTEHMAIVLDPDGIDGAPEVAYLLDVTSGAGVTGSSGLGRGKEGTTARAHVAGTPWVHAPTLRDTVRSKKSTLATGDVTTTSASYTTVSSTLDVVVPALAGDVIEYGLICIVANSGASNLVSLDPVTWVSSAAVNSLSGATDGFFRIQNPTAAGLTPFGGSMMYDVVSGDLVSGLLTVRLLWKTNGGTATLYADGTTRRAQVHIKNLGPATAVT